MDPIRIFPEGVCQVQSINSSNPPPSRSPTHQVSLVCCGDQPTPLAVETCCRPPRLLAQSSNKSHPPLARRRDPPEFIFHRAHGYLLFSSPTLLNSMTVPPSSSSQTSAPFLEGANVSTWPRSSTPPLRMIPFATQRPPATAASNLSAL
jgi:hypothetical protein